MTVCSPRRTESRRQIQRDLHDGAQQRLVHAILTLELAQAATAAHDCPAAGPIDEALQQVRKANEDVRDLARGILPVTLTRHGLRATLQGFADDVPLELGLDVEDFRFPAAIETAAYFVVVEAVTNVLKHSHADRADVEAKVRGGVLEIQVRDGGTGGADFRHGTGSRGLVDRLEASRGELHVESPPHGGTTVRARLPVPDARGSHERG